MLGAENPTGHWELFYTSPRIIYVRCLLYLFSLRGYASILPIPGMLF